MMQTATVLAIVILIFGVMTGMLETRKKTPDNVVMAWCGVFIFMSTLYLAVLSLFLSYKFEHMGL